MASTSKIILILAICLALSAGAISAASAPPTIISYQGRLADSDGQLLGGAGATYYFKISFWNDAASGNQVWPTTTDPTVSSSTVRHGLFNLNIGDTANGYPDVLDYDFSANPNIYLQIKVSADNVDANFETLSPRQPINSAAFAQLAGSVQGAGASAMGSLVVSSGATTSNLAITGLATPDGTFLAVNSLGQVIATTTPAGGIETDPFYAVASSTILRFGTTTDALTEGTNKFYTQARNWTDIAASSTLTTTLNNSITAYGWGNHALAGYLSNLLGGLNGIFGNTTTTNATTSSLAITNIASAYLAVNSQGSFIATTTPILTETDPVWIADKSGYLTLSAWYATTTTALTEGNNLYWTSDRFAVALAGTTTTALPDALNKRYVTDAYLTVLGNTTNTNSGDVTMGASATLGGLSISSQVLSLATSTLKTAMALVKGDVGLGSVDNTADSAKNVLSATKWTTIRALTTSGDVVVTSANWDGSGDFTSPATIANDAVTFAKMQNGNYGGIIGRNTAGAGDYAELSTSTYKTMLALNTNDLTEGSNLFWTDTRFDTRLYASTSLPLLATLSGLSMIGSSTGQTTILGKTIMTNASTTETTVANKLTVSGNSSLQNASTTNLSASGWLSVTGNGTIAGTLGVNGNTTLGDALADTVTVNAGIEVQPSNASSNIYKRYRNIYVFSDSGIGWKLVGSVNMSAQVYGGAVCQGKITQHYYSTYGDINFYIWILTSGGITTPYISYYGPMDNSNQISLRETSDDSEVYEIWYYGHNYDVADFDFYYGGGGGGVDVTWDFSGFGTARTIGSQVNTAPNMDYLFSGNVTTAGTIAANGYALNSAYGVYSKGSLAGVLGSDSVNTAIFGALGYAGTYGVYGSGGTYAGYFNGDTYISAKLGIASTTPSATLSVNATAGTSAFTIASSTAGSNTLTVSPYGALLINSIGTTTNTKLYVVGGVSGAGWVSNTAGTWISSSDANLKKDILPLSPNDSLASILKLNPVSFDWKESNVQGIGLIAQEVEKVYPQMVEEMNGRKGLAYSQLVPVLISAIKKQQTEIDELKARLEIVSASGNWSINEAGGLVVKDIKADTATFNQATITTGVTVRDDDTGEYQCLSVANGAVEVRPGQCTVKNEPAPNPGPIITPISPSESTPEPNSTSTPPAEVSTTTTPESSPAEISPTPIETPIVPAEVSPAPVEDLEL